NGDGIQGLAVANYDTGMLSGTPPVWPSPTPYIVSVLLGNGHGTFQTAPTVGVGAQPISVAVGDFHHNGDGVKDLAVANFKDNTVSVLRGDGHGAFRPAGTFAVSTNPAFVAVRDFNGDGVPDLAVADMYANTIAVLVGYGNGAFQAPRFSDAGSPGPCPAGAQCGPLSFAVGDFNRDGKQDLAVALYRTN